MKRSFFLMVLVGHFCLFTCQLHEYHYVDQNMNWTGAQQHCRKEYTDLATVSTMADMEQLRNIHSEKTEIWIGLFNLTGINVTSHWSLPGLQFNESQAKWKSGEPDGFTSETCGAVIDITEKQWVDTSCMDKAHFLCYNGSTSSAYKYYLGDKMTWFDALRYCRVTHTDLISGPQLEELQGNPTEKIIQLYNGTRVNNLDSLSTFQYIFIGLFRDAWTWLDGSSFSFRYWNLLYNSMMEKKNCTMRNTDGMWETRECHEKKPFFCYTDHVILVKENRTWEEALYYCRHHHHDLVTITNPEDQIWVQEKTKNASSPFVWTGLRYTCSLGFWFWVSDEVVRYKNWASPGQVNECDMSGAMETGGEHKWFKKHDEDKFNFFCSK
ncbi:C-type mannose receptor 2-like [Oryzias latipes]|uniref:C-type mannose receptor 2-like n=1 Tax=Oryzias latipes TaxID=8090 RepID=UPI0009DB14C5|nr:C-type mannose receptor 2-like [Oryzias latipes]XP_020567190.1 C-type mannose receptor 2-like [Oryzias latipes]